MLGVGWRGSRDGLPRCCWRCGARRAVFLPDVPYDIGYTVGDKEDEGQGQRPVGFHPAFVIRIADKQTENQRKEAEAGVESAAKQNILLEHFQLQRELLTGGSTHAQERDLESADDDGNEQRQQLAKRSEKRPAAPDQDCNTAAATYGQKSP